MLTPVDIENKEFTKAFRGYDIYEVEEFMKTLVADYEKLYRENGDLKDKNAVLNDALGNYKGMEETMQNAILVAQRTAEDIKQNAYERSETIVKDAERRAAETIDQANRSIGHLEKAYMTMQREMNGFKAKMNALLSTYMQLLSDLPEQGIPQAVPEKAAEPVAAAPAPQPVMEEIVESAAGEVFESAADKAFEDVENTNTFTLPTKKAEMVEEPKAPVERVTVQSAGFIPERKLNPVVEELLRKKREEQNETKEVPVETKPAESFAVTRETIQKEPVSAMSEIDLSDLKAFDVFSDDTI